MITRSIGLLQWLVLILCFTSSHPLYCSEFSSHQLHISGFATVALTHSDNKRFGFRREIEREGTFDGEPSFAADSVVGLQIDFSAGDKFSGALQLVGKDRARDTLNNSMEWAFLRYDLNPELTARAGRIGFDFFMLSEYRSVGFAYLWTRPPTEYYTLVSFPSFDGLDLAWSRRLGAGNLRIKAYAGDAETTSKQLSQSRTIELRNIMGTSAEWESNNWRFRLSASTAHLGEEGEYFPGAQPLAEALYQAAPLWPQASSLAANLKAENNRINYFSSGLTYSGDLWQIVSEVSHFATHIEAFPSQNAGYISAGYKIGNLTPFAVISSAQTEGGPEIVPDAPTIPLSATLSSQLAELQQATQFFYETSNVNQTSGSLGLRWNFRYNMAIKAQWDHTKVKQHGFAGWERRQVSTKDQAINTFSISFNTVF